ncbi:DEAD/DEAH box helicase [Pelagibacteraceae bacterium]|nr:DEAD/DEAH box helicase [Pelagibacteraceae bacterium]
MENFNSLNLEKTLMDSIAVINFKTPTPIQAKAIPIALEGKDILGTAQTGTGKTAAFGIPLINFLLKTQKDTALVMTPTRELATQVMQTMTSLIGRGNIRTALLIGGDSMQKQLRQMQRNPRLIVGTPGRINDHLKRRTLKLQKTTFLVLDESDRMLDMGFTPQINQVLETVPEKHQTLLFSATLANNIVRLAERYLKNPVRISVGSTSTPIDKIKQETLHVKDGDKYNQLIKEIYNRQGAILIFVKTRRNAEKMVKRLKYDDHDADAIHGNLRQNKRDKVIKAFRNGHFRILVGTDVASRGLDIPAIKHVINFDLPQLPEDFIHRIGRTARAGAEGSALSFIGGDDRSKWNAIQRLIDPNFKQDKNSRDHKRKRGGRSFDRRGSRGSDRFSERKPFSKFRRDDNKKSSFGKKRDDRRGSFSDQRNDNRSSSGFRREENRGSFGKKRDDRRGSFSDQRNDNRSSSGFRREENRGSFGKKRDDRRGSFSDQRNDNRSSSGFRRDGDKSSFGEKNGSSRKSSGFKKKFNGGKKKSFNKFSKKSW